MLVADGLEAAAGEGNGFVPARLAEDVHHARRVHHEVARLRRRILAPDQRLGQALRVVRVVEAVAPLDAQAALVGRAIAALDEEDLVVLDVVGQLAADAAIRAHRLDLPVGHAQCRVARGHQRAGRAGLHTFAAGHAGRRAHRVVHVENDLRVLAAEGQADDVVDLLVAAGAQAARALDAGVEVDGDGRVRQVLRRLRARSEARLVHAELGRPLVDLVVARVVALGHVGLQQLEHQLLRLDGALAVGRDLHALARMAAARRRQHALAVDLDHAGAAVADLLQAGLVAKVRDLDAFAPGDLDDRLVGSARDLAPVELERHGGRIQRRPFLAGDGIHVSGSMERCAMNAAG